MAPKGFVALVGSSMVLGYAFVLYRLKLTRREALKRFEESEDGRRLSMQSISFAPKMQSDDPDVSQQLLREYMAADQSRKKA